MADFNTTAAEIGALVTEKNLCYGNSFAKCGEFLRLLYPEGVHPPQYDDALAMVRIFDKQMRIATRKDAFGESPYRDIAGYGILGAVKDGTLSPAGEGSDPLVKDATAESLCHTCQRNKGCDGWWKRTEEGGCEGYRLPPITIPPPAPLRERILDAKQEAPLPDMGCATTDCCNHSMTYLRNCAAYLPGAMLQCEKYTTAKQEAPTAAEQPAAHTDPAVNCKDCAPSACGNRGFNITQDLGCNGFRPKEAAL